LLGFYVLKQIFLMIIKLNKNIKSGPHILI